MRKPYPDLILIKPLFKKSSLVYSYKTILFISTAAVSSTTYAFLLFPSISTDLFDVSFVGQLLSVSSAWALGVAKSKNTNVLSGNLLLKNLDEPLLLSNEFTSSLVTNTLPVFDLALFGINFLAVAFFIDLFLTMFTSNIKAFFWFKPFNFLKTNFFLSYTFMTSVDALLAFVYFFFSLYFLELHFFFVYSLNISSDSAIYQFNFLLSSFFFIFVVKTLRALLEKGFIFSMSFQFNEFNQFHSAEIDKFAFEAGGSNVMDISFVEDDDYVTMVRVLVRAVFFVFFFFSTFFVWLLRFIIQFVRLLVLFMIHTIFELVIVSSDSVLSCYATNYLFIFKYLFFIFFFFGSFLYLILYLNLMFTLQVFIFYFFSEVFQSNFITDLSSFVSNKIKKI